MCWYVGMGAGTQLRAHWSEVGIRVSEGCGGSADRGVGVVRVCGVRCIGPMRDRFRRQSRGDASARAAAARVACVLLLCACRCEGVPAAPTRQVSWQEFVDVVDSDGDWLDDGADKAVRCSA